MRAGPMMRPGRFFLDTFYRTRDGVALAAHRGHLWHSHGGAPAGHMLGSRLTRNSSPNLWMTRSSGTGLSTIKRRLCAIAFAHRVSDLPTPSEHNPVRLAIRRAAR